MKRLKKMKDAIKVFMICMLVLSISGLAGCGKVSNPEPIEGSGYPHIYPRR